MRGGVLTYTHNLCIEQKRQKYKKKFSYKKLKFTSPKHSLYITWVLSRLMGKQTICIGENKDADQLRGNHEADQRLCFRYSDSTISPLLKSKISIFYSCTGRFVSDLVGNHIVGFLTRRLICVCDL